MFYHKPWTMSIGHLLFANNFMLYFSSKAWHISTIKVSIVFTSSNFRMIVVSAMYRDLIVRQTLLGQWIRSISLEKTTFKINRKSQTCCSFENNIDFRFVMYYCLFTILSTVWRNFVQIVFLLEVLIARNRVLESPDYQAGV